MVCVKGKQQAMLQGFNIIDNQGILLWYAGGGP